MEGNTALGASSPAKPALHIPEPLSITKALTSSSMISQNCRDLYNYIKNVLLNLYIIYNEGSFKLKQVNTKHLTIECPAIR